MRIYLDMCCFNRPYDDQSQARIHIETQGKLLLQQRVRDGACDLVWSSVLDLECANNPFPDRQLAIFKWRQLASDRILVDDQVVTQAEFFESQGVARFDALHSACALRGQADIFVSTDDRLLRKLRKLGKLTALLPGEAIARLENWYEN